MIRFPLFNLFERYASILPDFRPELNKVISFSKFVNGDILTRFEENFAKYHGDNLRAVGVGSGLDALILSLRALGIGEGDEVIVPSHTFIATAFAVDQVGAKVRFVDVEENTALIDPVQIEKNINDRTKAVIAVHLYGQPCDLDELVRICREHEIFLIEDCAQATGAEYKSRKVGTFGICGCFSFYPTKPLGGIAQGGMVISENLELIEKIRSFGNVGRQSGTWNYFDKVGYNSRLDTINALFLDKCLPLLDEWNQKRRYVANLYEYYLKDIKAIDFLFSKSNTKAAPHLYMIKVDKSLRDNLIKYLESNSIASGIYYPIPCHKQEIYNHLEVSLPITEDLVNRLLALPMDTYLTHIEIDYICSVIRNFFE